MNQTPILLKDKISEETQYSINKFYRNGHFYTNAQLYEFRSEILATIERNRLEKRFNNTLSNRVTASSAKEMVDYLIGDVDNHNLFGTILGFSKKKGNKFSFFLYYSHETGRIERILFNPGSTRDDLNISYGDLKMNTLTINDARILNKDTELETEKFISENSQAVYDQFKKTITSYYPLRLLNLEALTDGKLNKQMFDAFTIELFRDYLWTFRSFTVTDMGYLKQCTKPVYSDSGYYVGCGLPNLESFNTLFKKRRQNKK